MLRILRISGDSMSPDYQDGDFVLLMKLIRGRIKGGDVVIFENKLYGTLIKRVDKISDEGFYVIGTRENSLDSRRLGPVNPNVVQGKVIWHIRRR